MADETINRSANIEQTDRAFRDSFKNQTFRPAAWTNDYYKRVFSPVQATWANIIQSELYRAYFTFPEAAGAEMANDYRLNRVFFQNNTGTDQTVVLGGKRFPLEDGAAYACHPSEWLQIDKNAKENGFTLDRVDATEWWNEGDLDLLFFFN